MAEGNADDVAFIGKLLDDLCSVVKVDEKRVYACGMSNGGRSKRRTNYKPDKLI